MALFLHALQGIENGVLSVKQAFRALGILVAKPAVATVASRRFVSPDAILRRLE